LNWERALARGTVELERAESSAARFTVAAPAQDTVKSTAFVRGMRGMTRMLAAFPPVMKNYFFNYSLQR
jgi:hypothetical protein